MKEQKGQNVQKTVPKALCLSLNLTLTCSLTLCLCLPFSVLPSELTSIRGLRRTIGNIDRLHTAVVRALGTGAAVSAVGVQAALELLAGRRLGARQRGQDLTL